MTERFLASVSRARRRLWFRWHRDRLDQELRASLLYQVAATDSSTFAVVTLLLSEWQSPRLQYRRGVRRRSIR